MQLLRSQIHRDNGFRVRPARNDDWPAIERLLIYAERQYLALEWWTIQEWLGRPTFLLLSNARGRSLGFMLTVASGGPVGWLRGMAVAADRHLAPLIQANIEAALEQSVTGLAYLGDEGWVLAELQQAGFHKVNQVVTLRRRGRRPVHHGPLDLQLRTATAADLDAILAVDHAAFGPLWWYSREILNRALNMAFCFDVAYLEGECVGYQLCTLRNGRGHIVRLAVHPARQRRGVGGRLLSEAIGTLDAAGAEMVTVNTQEDNLASLQLYQHFAFDQVGRPWAVWFRSLVEE